MHHSPLALSLRATSLRRDPPRLRYRPLCLLALSHARVIMWSHSAFELSHYTVAITACAHIGCALPPSTIVHFHSSFRLLLAHAWRYSCLARLGLNRYDGPHRTLYMCCAFSVMVHECGPSGPHKWALSVSQRSLARSAVLPNSLARSCVRH